MIKHYKAIRIKISLLWIPAIILLPWLHITKIVGFIFLILSVHELAHVIVALLCHYQVKQVTIYPFGLGADIPQLGYGSLIKETCIIAAGPLSQVIFPSVFSIILQKQWISYDFYMYVMMINASIMVFNLLPIYPLDGGRLLQTCFHSIFRFTMAQYCTCITSIIVLSLLFYSQFMKSGSGYVVQVFLLIQIFICIKEKTHTRLKFYHYRFLHPVTYAMIVNQKRDLFRGRYNLMKVSDGYEMEEDWLQHHFKNVRKR